MRPTFTAGLIALLVLTSIAGAQPAATKPAAIEFPTFGVILTPPAGWERQFEPSIGIMARFFPPEGNRDRAEFSVDVGRTIGLTPRGEADDLIKHTGGVAEDTTLDNERACVVRHEKQGRIILFAERGGRAYMISYARPGAFDPAEFDAVRTSWRWCDVVNPAQCAKLDPAPVLILGRVAVCLPGSFRPEAKPDAGHAVFYSLNYSKPKAEADYRVDFSYTTSGATPAKAAAAIGQNFAAKAGLNRAVKWASVGNQNRLLSEPLPVDNGMTMRWAVVGLDEKTLIEINCLMSKEFAQQAKLAEEIVSSLELAN